MTEITKKFRVLEYGKYRIAIKVSGGSRLSEILLGDAKIDFGFVRSISGGALFLSDIITASRGKEIFFKILSDSATFAASEFRTFFRAIDTNIKFQDIVAEQYEIPDDPGGGGEEPPPGPPEPPEVDYGPDLTPSSWYAGYTRYNFSSNTLEVTIPSNGVYQLAIVVAEPYFVESATVTGGSQWNPDANTVTTIPGLTTNAARYYYNSKDTVADELSFDYVKKITVRLNTSDPDAPYRGSAIMLRRKRDLDIAAKYINRLVAGELSNKQYVGMDGASIAESIGVYAESSYRSFRLVAARADGVIKSETSVPDNTTLKVSRSGAYVANTPYNLSALSSPMWPAKGTEKILAKAMNSADGNTYDRWVSKELILGGSEPDIKYNYPTCWIHRTGSIAKYQIDPSTGTASTGEIVNPKTGKSETVKFPIGVTTSSYVYAKLVPCGRVIASRRVKLTNNFNVTDNLQAWRNATPLTFLDSASEELKRNSNAVLVVEMIQSANSSNYDSATNTFKVQSTGYKGLIYVSPFAPGEDGIDYSSLGTASEYQKYIKNNLVKTADGKRYETVWSRIDYAERYHRIFFNVTGVNTSGAITDSTTLRNTWFVHNDDPSHVYHFIYMKDIFGTGSKFNANAAKRIMAFPAPGQDIYISILDATPSLRLSSGSLPISIPVSV